MYKENENIDVEIRMYTMTNSCARIQLPEHWAMLALNN